MHKIAIPHVQLAKPASSAVNFAWSVISRNSSPRARQIPNIKHNLTFLVSDNLVMAERNKSCIDDTGHADSFYIEWFIPAFADTFTCRYNSSIICFHNVTVFKSRSLCSISLTSYFKDGYILSKIYYIYQNFTNFS